MDSVEISPANQTHYASLFLSRWRRFGELFAFGCRDLFFFVPRGLISRLNNGIEKGAKQEDQEALKVLPYTGAHVAWIIGDLHTNPAVQSHPAHQPWKVNLNFL